MSVRPIGLFVFLFPTWERSRRAPLRPVTDLRGNVPASLEVTTRTTPSTSRMTFRPGTLPRGPRIDSIVLPRLFLRHGGGEVLGRNRVLDPHQD